MSLRWMNNQRKSLAFKRLTSVSSKRSKSRGLRVFYLNNTRNAVTSQPRFSVFVSRVQVPLRKLPKMTSTPMTYARARLWLGIFGVGSLVTICTVALLCGLAPRWLSSSTQFSGSDLLQLSGIALIFIVWLAPFDFLGGYRLPQKYLRSDESFGKWLSSYLGAAIAQSLLFIAFAWLILLFGRWLGLRGAVSVVVLAIGFCFVLRNRSMRFRRVESLAGSDKLLDSLTLIQSWQIFVPNIIVVRHQDVGFTGGIIGFGNSATIVIPQAWLGVMSKAELATVIARRAIAFNSGSYYRGLTFACGWNLLGFVICTQLPNAGVESVAALANTICGFTLWSFLGLLTLPTLSRNASLQIDHLLSERGTPKDLIYNTADSFDRMQDGEHSRPRWVEMIFHPVPSVGRRNARPHQGPAAWNVARTALFFSWACFGVLSRAVHCNVGRPELWTMLPID